eukprot:TRINITY_DN27756_c0_g1_i1.p1 TRINITY_DN27756_c0_g1~~TRINITY_DN27756_c0_g1_i1.p1  ORF type:complete len:299 (+),score=42.66 TRINITY_DN27756_c0_g1_i1:188-1084(+)
MHNAGGAPAHTPACEIVLEEADTRVRALRAGVDAVLSAMETEGQFANENERAFALLRRGCRHCAARASLLDQVEQKALVLSFLSRIACRRALARQLKELVDLLAVSPTWLQLLQRAASDPGPFGELLSECLPLCTEAVPVAASSAVAVVPREPLSVPAPAADARIFLRDQRSQWYLTVAASGVDEHRCVMTELPTSLFVCHHRTRTEEGACRLGLEHEGLPSPCRFLGSRARWRHALKGADPQLSCTSRQLGAQEEFWWHADSSLQHASSGRWLYVDPDHRLQLSNTSGSAWDALLAT